MENKSERSTHQPARSLQSLRYEVHYIDQLVTFSAASLPYVDYAPVLLYGCAAAAAVKTKKAIKNQVACLDLKDRN